MMFLKGYHGPARLVQVNKAESPMALEWADHGDIVTVYTDRFVFPADNYTYVLPEELRKRVQELDSYDIVTIDEQGILEPIFEVSNRDATVFITGRCNSNCIMCPTSDNERRKDGISEDWLERYVELLPFDTPHIVVTGGEPTLRTELFFRIMGRIADKFPSTETLLLTNGRSFASLRMTDRLLEHCPQLLQIAIPIHGENPSVHDAITQAPGSFEQTCLGLDHLLRRKLCIEIRIVVSRRNLTHLSNVASLIAKRFPAASIVNFIGLETRGSCAKNFKDVYIDCKDAFPYVKQAADILVQSGIDVSLYNFPLCSVDEGYRTLCQKSISPWKVRFPIECEACSAKKHCGGFFDTTLNMAHPAVFPII